MFVDSAVPASKQWYEIAAGVIAVPAGILALRYTYLSIKKTRLEIEKLEREAGPKTHSDGWFVFFLDFYFTQILSFKEPVRKAPNEALRGLVRIYAQWVFALMFMISFGELQVLRVAIATL